uniref:5-hydroxytryptamine receptor-like n=1 Tax=Vespula vulgaris TaxID=7454 RepID=UPI00223C2EE6|nr:5-hydroxytryptamine receptor-like [Vespula vulgaris]XP_050853115.1 5-hydroxytryptamine receptor-like [Vespula vulgaris]XP_050853116.1 5-hydroxytryptamine receptor-like [Vespula vulgaris]
MEENISIATNATVKNFDFSDPWVILRAVVLALLILITIIGNLFVIAVIQMQRNLRSVANYLIVSLAFADLMVACLAMPLGAVYEINSRWSLGPELCDIWTSSDVLCCTASILHLVAIAVDRYWAVTDLNYTQGRSPKKIGILIAMVWIVSLGISMAPHFGWKDPDYLERIAEGECLVSQDPAYQIIATCATFYLPCLLILFLYWKIFQAARKRIRKRPGTIVQPCRERRGILRLVTRRQREESTAFTITRSTPDHSSISPEKSSSYNDGHVVQSTVVNITPVTTSTTANSSNSTDQPTSSTAATTATATAATSTTAAATSTTTATTSTTAAATSTATAATSTTAAATSTTAAETSTTAAETSTTVAATSTTAAETSTTAAATSTIAAATSTTAAATSTTAAATSTATAATSTTAVATSTTAAATSTATAATSTTAAATSTRAAATVVATSTTAAATSTTAAATAATAAAIAAITTTITTPATTTTTTSTSRPSSSSTSTTIRQATSTKRNRETIESKREKKAAKTLAIITGAFVACWLPFFVLTLLRVICDRCQIPDMVYKVFLWLGYFNSTLNPVIYTIFSPEFRQGFKRMLCSWRMAR